MHTFAFDNWKNQGPAQWQDPVLDWLVLMGTLNWAGFDHHHYTQSIQCMWYSFVLGPQLKLELMKLEDLVHPPSLLSVFDIGWWWFTQIEINHNVVETRMDVVDYMSGHNFYFSNFKFWQVVIPMLTHFHTVIAFTPLYPSVLIPPYDFHTKTNTVTCLHFFHTPILTSSATPPSLDHSSEAVHLCMIQPRLSIDLSLQVRLDWVRLTLVRSVMKLAQLIMSGKMR